MAAKRIQSKLFAKQAGGSAPAAAAGNSSSGSTTPSGSNGKAPDDLGPLQQVRDSFSAESAPNTIQKEGTSLKVRLLPCS
jgi:hypothetical protein